MAEVAKELERMAAGTDEVIVSGEGGEVRVVRVRVILYCYYGIYSTGRFELGSVLRFGIGTGLASNLTAGLGFPAYGPVQAPAVNTAERRKLRCVRAVLPQGYPGGGRGKDNVLAPTAGPDTRKHPTLGECRGCRDAPVYPWAPAARGGRPLGPATKR